MSDTSQEAAGKQASRQNMLTICKLLILLNYLSLEVARSEGFKKKRNDMYAAV